LGPPDEIQDFPTQLLESLLEEARPFGIRHVALIGGEPGLHPEFDRIVEMVADAGYTWRFPSNGQCRELYESSMRRHRESLHHVTLSIDGADAETHDYIRRKEGAFERVTLTARYYTKMGFPVRVGTTLNRKNREQVEALIRLATDLQAYGSPGFCGVPPRSGGMVYSAKN